MRSDRLVFVSMVVLLCLVWCAKCASAQFLDRAVHRDLCDIGQLYVHELASLLERSADTSYPALEAAQMHARYHRRYWDFFDAHCSDCDNRAWLPCKEFVKELCTGIRRWGQAHFPGVLSPPDGIKKSRAVLMRFCPDLVIPVLRKDTTGAGKQGSR